MLEVIDSLKHRAHRYWPDVASFLPLICRDTSENFKRCKRYVMFTINDIALPLVT